MKPDDKNEIGRLPTVSEPASGPADSSTQPEVEGYEILSVLNEGGMGVVYLARQTHPMRRRVAIKVVKPGMDSQQVIARFEMERQALALLDHPHIAQVYDAGTTQDGRPYFAMEYVKGLPITEYCDRERLGIEQRLSLFKHVCEAVQHAHQKGIIHRDIKPSNILVYMDEDQTVTKIIDFGVAKAVGPSLTDQTCYTEAGQLVGTPEYMSPEQSDMVSQDIDTRSDIYSLGVVLYELLAGVLPFESEALRQGGIDQLRKLIRHEIPKTPSTRLTGLGERADRVAQNRCTEVRALVRCLHRELEWIPLKAMRKERKRRYRSVAELADDIQNYLQGAPLMAGPESPVYRAKKFVGRHRALVVSATTIVIGLMVSVCLSVFFAVRAEYALADQQALSDWVRQHFFGAINSWDVDNHDLTLRPMLDAASQSLEQRPLEQPLVEAWIREKILGTTYHKLDLYEQAAMHQQYALDLYQRYLGGRCPAVFACMVDLGRTYCCLEQDDRAADLLVDALAMGQTLEGVDAVALLFAQSNLVAARIRQGRHGEVEPIAVDALNTARLLLGEGADCTLSLMNNLGVILQKQECYKEAEALFLMAAEGRRQAAGAPHPKTIEHLAELYENWGEPNQAEHWRACLPPLGVGVDKQGESGDGP